MENLATSMERECDEALGLFNQDLMWVEIGKKYKLWFNLSMEIFDKKLALFSLALVIGCSRIGCSDDSLGKESNFALGTTTWWAKGMFRAHPRVKDII